MLESRTGASATDVEVLQMRCWQEKEADVRELCCCCAVSGDCDALRVVAVLFQVTDDCDALRVVVVLLQVTDDYDALHVVAVLFQVTVMHSMLLLCCFR